MTTETGLEVEPATLRPERRIGTRIGRALWLLVILAFLVALYYFAGAWWIEEIEADPDFGASIEVPQGGSHAVALAAGLVDREVNLHYWTANDPGFLPGSLLDNMPSFQVGMVSALARFTVELRDQMARVRGSSQSDPDLEPRPGGSPIRAMSGFSSGRACPCSRARRASTAGRQKTCNATTSA